MGDRNWFQQKWGTPEVPTDILFKRIGELEERIIKLEDENISTTNELYRLQNSLDARIDILAEKCGCIEDV